MVRLDNSMKPTNVDGVPEISFLSCFVGRNHIGSEFPTLDPNTMLHCHIQGEISPPVLLSGFCRYHNRLNVNIRYFLKNIGICPFTLSTASRAVSFMKHAPGRETKPHPLYHPARLFRAPSRDRRARRPAALRKSSLLLRGLTFSKLSFSI
jgi:hypothetical protein